MVRYDLVLLVEVLSVWIGVSWRARSQGVKQVGRSQSSEGLAESLKLRSFEGEASVPNCGYTVN